MKRELTAAPLAGDDARRQDVIRRGFGGLDYIDVRADGRTLVVGFFGALPAGLSHEHFRVDGGERVSTIRVTSVRAGAGEPQTEGVVTVRLDRTGDASAYVLRVHGVAGLDPLFTALPFTFARDGKRLTDCAETPSFAVDIAPLPHIDYLAKDYATFRRLLLDRAALVMPAWTESHVPDLNLTLVELLAYAGDQLSYFQDAVATEAYLGTARKRISVRRHARLLDYRMHDGLNARAWLILSADADAGPIDPDTVRFTTLATAAAAAQSFEPLQRNAIHVYAAHAPMRLYAWGNATASLRAGATGATLRDAWESAPAGGEPQRALRRLIAGDCVAFECVREIVDGRIAPADTALRHAVRLTHVRRDVDPLYATPVVEIAWAFADRLPFDLPIVAPDPFDPAAVPLELSVVWGNLIAVDHGRTLDAPESLAPAPADAAGRYRPPLGQGPLTFAEPYAPGNATSLDVRDPRAAAPAMRELVTRDLEGHERRWTAAADLLGCGPNDTRFVVETDENGVATLRFGDGRSGRRPPAGATARARYRAGNGLAGNVGAESIVVVERRGAAPDAQPLRARNPLAARGGIEPESLDDVRTFAPSAWREHPVRAVTPDDYARLAQRDARLQRAAAVFRWTGARTIVRVALDPLGSEACGADLLADVATVLEPVRRIGHDVEVVAATYVPLRVTVRASVKRGYSIARVREALAAALGARVASDGTRGFFHADALSFGEPVAQSRLLARALGVDGIADASVRRLERLDAPFPDRVPVVLSIGALEIARLDNDPARPERGILELDLCEQP